MSKADLQRLIDHFGGVGDDIIASSHSNQGDDTAVVMASHSLEALRWLKESLGFDFLVDITAVDYLGRELRFEVVYHLRSMHTGARLRVKVQLGEIEDGPPPEIDSIVPLWPGADWLEREVW